MKRISLILAAIGACAAVSAPACDDRLYATSLAYARLEHPDRFLTTVAAWIGRNEEAKTQAARLISGLFLKNSNWDSFDSTRPITYAVLGPQQGRLSFVYCGWIRDRDLFFSGFGRGLFGGSSLTLNPQSSNEPIREYVESRTEFDRASYLAAAQKGKADPQQFMKKVQIPYYVACVDKRVIVSTHRETVRHILKKTGETVPPDAYDAEILIRPSQLYAVYGDAIREWREKAQALISGWSGPASAALANLDNIVSGASEAGLRVKGNPQRARFDFSVTREGKTLEVNVKIGTKGKNTKFEARNPKQIDPKSRTRDGGYPFLREKV